MTNDRETIAAQAAEWHVAILGGEVDWDAFTAWLEAAPDHARAYDEVALADAMLADHDQEFASSVPANDDEPIRRGRRWPLWGGAVVAASLAMALLLPQLRGHAPEVTETHATARTVSLADGSQIVVAPHSRLEVSGRGQSRIALAGGGWFDIRHDPSRSLTVTAGGLSITDIGTRFDVQTGDAGTRIAIAEGRVSVSGELLAGATTLAAGEGLTFDPRAKAATVSTLETASVGSWRSGRLSYEDMPLPLVAADLARYAGVAVRVDPMVATRRFSGTLALGNGTSAAQDLAGIMGLAVVRGPDGVRLVPAHR